tara:strand:+ start:62 stop:571 length:510 start_codon:yes stop_codon:yes gene_type:complete
MDSFLEKHVLLSNKNNILDIKLGSKKGDNIFDGNIKKFTIKNIVKNIKNKQKLKVKISSYMKEIYIKNNEYFTLNRDELVYEINNVKDYYIDKNFLIKNIEIIKDEYIIPTYNNYNYIEKSEILDIKLNNQIIVRVKNIDNNYCLSIIISKPIKLEFLKDIIDVIQENL